MKEEIEYLIRCEERKVKEAKASMEEFGFLDWFDKGSEELYKSLYKSYLMGKMLLQLDNGKFNEYIDYIKDEILTKGLNVRSTSALHNIKKIWELECKQELIINFSSLQLA